MSIEGKRNRKTNEEWVSVSTIHLIFFAAILKASKIFIWKSKLNTFQPSNARLTFSIMNYVESPKKRREISSARKENHNFKSVPFPLLNNPHFDSRINIQRKKRWVRPRQQVKFEFEMYRFSSLDSTFCATFQCSVQEIREVYAKIQYQMMKYDNIRLLNH